MEKEVKTIKQYTGRSESQREYYQMDGKSRRTDRHTQGTRDNGQEKNIDGEAKKTYARAEKIDKPRNTDRRSQG
eukprot:3075322-Heterocapsa_arctica.AAC.1